VASCSCTVATMGKDTLEMPSCWTLTRPSGMQLAWKVGA